MDEKRGYCRRPKATASYHTSASFLGWPSVSGPSCNAIRALVAPTGALNTPAYGWHAWLPPSSHSISWATTVLPVFQDTVTRACRVPRFFVAATTLTVYADPPTMPPRS